MSHSLICGVTESGKTTLAHALANTFAANGQNVIVYDPVGTLTASGSWPKTAVVFDDEEEFFEYLARDDVLHAHVFVDESGDIFNATKRHNLWLMTRGRHFGFNVYPIAQRPKMILPSARTMCGTAYVFRLASDDLKEIGKDFGFNDLDKETLDKGDFLVLHSGSPRYERGNIFHLLKGKTR